MRKRIVKLTEFDLEKIVRRVIKENEEGYPDNGFDGDNEKPLTRKEMEDKYKRLEQMMKNQERIIKQLEKLNKPKQSMWDKFWEGSDDDY